MADWSDLPQEILYLISLLLTASSSIDILRFRSVCTTWRRAAFRPRLLFPSSADLVVPLPGPIIPILGEYLHLAKRTLYHLQNNTTTSNNSNPSSWIIKFDYEHLCNPLISYYPLIPCLWKTLPKNFPRPFSFLNLRVRELGSDYSVWFPAGGNPRFIRKVAVLNELDNTFLMLLAEANIYVISKSGDEEWRFLTTNEVHYDDVIVMGGEFYVVASQGRQLARLNRIDWTEEIIVASPPTELEAKKFLVECQGNLLLVEFYYDYQFDYWFPDECEIRIETIQVFKLDENSREWMEVNDLGEIILFIGETCPFSVSAKDVFGETSTATGCKGNCIICWSEELYRTQVFDLETRTIKDLDSLPHYYKMFWPPPKWAYSASDN